MTRVTQLIHDAGKYLLISVCPLPTHPTHNFTHNNGGNLETLPGWPKKLQHNRPARSAGQWFYFYYFTGVYKGHHISGDHGCHNNSICGNYWYNKESESESESKDGVLCYYEIFNSLIMGGCVVMAHTLEIVVLPHCVVLGKQLNLSILYKAYTMADVDLVP